MSWLLGGTILCPDFRGAAFPMRMLVTLISSGSAGFGGCFTLKTLYKASLSFWLRCSRDCGTASICWMTVCLLMAVVSTPLIAVAAATGLLAVSVSFDLPVTLWLVARTAAAYDLARSTNVKPSCSISRAWEAFSCVRRDLPPGAAIGGALVVVLAVVRAVPFFAEVGVLKCVCVGGMDAATWNELMEAMCRKRWEAYKGSKVEVLVGGGRG